jgi:small-conductance mechanosensitive channel
MNAWLPQVDSSIVLDGLKSLLLLLSVVIARTVLVRSISKNSALTMEAKRRWVVAARNSMVFVFLLGLVVIWAHELQALAVSLVALAAALVLATKELLLCWSGAALRVGGKVYSVGDRIQIAGHRGVVLDHDIFITKLLEIGPGQASHLYTGRVTVFPNSLLLSNALVKALARNTASTRSLCPCGRSRIGKWPRCGCWRRRRRNACPSWLKPVVR